MFGFAGMVSRSKRDLNRQQATLSHHFALADSAQLDVRHNSSEAYHPRRMQGERFNRNLRTTLAPHPRLRRNHRPQPSTYRVHASYNHHGCQRLAATHDPINNVSVITTRDRFGGLAMVTSPPAHH